MINVQYIYENMLSITGYHGKQIKIQAEHRSTPIIKAQNAKAGML